MASCPPQQHTIIPIVAERRRTITNDLANVAPFSSLESLSQFDSADPFGSLASLSGAGASRSLTDVSRQNQARVVLLPNVRKADLLLDTLNGRLEPPLDLDTFRQYAEKNLCIENIDFLIAVQEFRDFFLPGNMSKDFYIEKVKNIIAKFIDDEAESMVNIPNKIRKPIYEKLGEIEKTPEETIRRSRPNSMIATGNQRNSTLVTVPSVLILDHDIFAEAYEHILNMTRTDTYRKFLDDVTLKTQIKFSRVEALWFTMRPLPPISKFFTFPNPINEAESRIHNVCVCLLVGLAVLLDYYFNFPWLYPYIVYGYLTRSVCGPRLDPQAFFVLFVARPLIADRLGIIRNKYVAGIPKQAAQIAGLTFALCASAFTLCARFYDGYPYVIDGQVQGRYMPVAWGFWGLIFFASFCSGVLDFCFVCEIIYLGSRLGYLPKELCDDCQAQYIDNVKYKRERKNMSKLSMSSSIESNLANPISASAEMNDGHDSDWRSLRTGNDHEKKALSKEKSGSKMRISKIAISHTNSNASSLVHTPTTPVAPSAPLTGMNPPVPLSNRVSFMELDADKKNKAVERKPSNIAGHPSIGIVSGTSQSPDSIELDKMTSRPSTDLQTDSHPVTTYSVSVTIPDTLTDRSRPETRTSESPAPASDMTITPRPYTALTIDRGGFNQVTIQEEQEGEDYDRIDLGQNNVTQDNPQPVQRSVTPSYRDPSPMLPSSHAPRQLQLGSLRADLMLAQSYVDPDRNRGLDFV